MAKSPFLESIRTFMIVRNYSKRTIESYLHWIKYFIIFNHKQHPDKLRVTEIEALMTAEPYKTRPAVTPCGNTGFQPAASSPDDGEVDLHLLTRQGFKPDNVFFNVLVVKLF